MVQNYMSKTLNITWRNYLREETTREIHIRQRKHLYFVKLYTHKSWQFPDIALIYRIISLRVWILQIIMNQIILIRMLPEKTYESLNSQI